MSSPVPPEVTDALVRPSRPLLVGHVTPDADCLSSMYGLATGLAAVCNATPRIALPPGSVSDRLTFLASWADVQIATNGDLESADAVITLDSAKLSRLNVEGGGQSLARPGRPIINIDHHVTNPAYGQFNWVVGDASSTAELVFYVLQALNVAITADLASMLYAGIHADTDGFALPNTTADALATAAELVRGGARVEEVCEKLQRSRRQADFDLLRILYANTRRAAGGRIAYSTVTHAELTGAGCRAEDIDDQVNVPRSLDGIDIAILFTEGVQGKVRINFRGEKGISVLPLAELLKGGGHRQAAGAIIPGTVEEVVARVVEEAGRHLAT